MAQRRATKAELERLIPELCAEFPQLAGEILDVTADMINLDYWGLEASRAHAWLAAHFLFTTSTEGNPGGVITSRKIDKIQENYAVATASDPELSTSRFGRIYIALRKTLIVAPLVGRSPLLHDRTN